MTPEILATTLVETKHLLEERWKTGKRVEGRTGASSAGVAPTIPSETTTNAPSRTTSSALPVTSPTTREVPVTRASTKTRPITDDNTDNLLRVGRFWWQEYDRGPTNRQGLRISITKRRTKRWRSLTLSMRRAT